MLSVGALVLAMLGSAGMAQRDQSFVWYAFALLSFLALVLYVDRHQ